MVCTCMAERGFQSILTISDAFIATIMKQLNKKRPLNAFQRGIRNVTYMMIAFMLVMVPIVSVQCYSLECLPTVIGPGH